MKSFLTTLMTVFVVFATFDLFAATKEVETTLRVKKVSKKHVVKVKANLPYVAVGFFGAEVSMQIRDTPWSAGVYAESSQFGVFTRFAGYGLGGTAAYHFKGSPYTDTWYVSSGVYYRQGVATSIFSSDINADYSMTNVTALAGYQWHWTDFNMSVGFGGTAVQAKVNINVDSNASTSAVAAASTDYSSDSISASGASSGAMLEFNVGYSF